MARRTKRPSLKDERYMLKLDEGPHEWTMQGTPESLAVLKKIMSLHPEMMFADMTSEISAAAA